MKRFRQSITLLAIAVCLPVCSASFAQRTDASKNAMTPKTAAEFKQRGDKLVAERQYEEAIADYDAALRLAPQDVEILLGRGKARVLNGEPDKAIADADAVIKIDSKRFDGYLLRGLALQVQHKLDEALEDFERAVRIAPKNAECYWRRGHLLTRIERIDAASKDFDAAVRLAPKQAKAYGRRGHFLYMIGRLDDALVDVEKAISIDPNKAPYLLRAAIYVDQGKLDKALADYDRAIRFDPNNGWAYSRRALLYQEIGRFDNATADHDQAIRLRPKDPHMYSQRADTYLRQKKKNYDKAIADLKTAIRLHPNDAGADYKPHAKVKLSAAALAHGQEQVRRMLKDRPNMAKYVDENDVLWKWAARKFAGEDLGVTIDWDPSEPRFALADHLSPDERRRGRIRVRRTLLDEIDKGRELTFGQLWSNAIYELHNINGVEDFKAITEAAAEGSIPKEQFVARMFSVEYRAEQETRAFFAHVYLPWAKQKRLPRVDLSWWHCDRFESAERTFLDFADKTQYPWRPYAIWYTSLRVKQMLLERQFDAAFALLDKELAAAADDTGRAEVHTLKGFCHAEQGDSAAAIKAFTHSIRLDPNDVDAYVARASAYQQRGQFDKAIEDSSQAIRIAPKNADGYDQRAYAYLTLGKIDQALADYDEMLRLNPKNAVALAGRGKAWLSKGEFDKALADLNRAIAIESPHRYLFFERADVWQAMGKPDRAIADFGEVLRRDPKNALALASRGAARLSTGKLEKALADLNRAIAIEPAYSRFYLKRAEIWQATGKPERAIADFNNVVGRDPKNVAALNGLAWTLATCPQAKCRDGKKAVEHARRACVLTMWKNWNLLNTFAAASAEAGDFAAAVKWQTEAVKLAPDEPKKEKQEMRARLDLFKAKKPYREGPAKKTIPARSASK